MLVTGQRRGTPYFPSAARSLRLWPRGRAVRWSPSFRNSLSDSGRARTALGAPGSGRTGRTKPALALILECACDMVALGTPGVRVRSCVVRISRYPREIAVRTARGAGHVVGAGSPILGSL